MSDLNPSEVRALVEAVPYWHHVMRFPHEIVSPGVYDPRWVQLDRGLQSPRR